MQKRAASVRESNGRITVLAGGVGAARFVAGLAACVDPASITVICNVGDDFEWQGLYIAPDIDTVTYTLAGLEGEAGWGLRDDSTVTLDALQEIDGDNWFRVGDRDLATHLQRTRMLRAGQTLAEATAELARARGLSSVLVPVTNDPHPTMVVTDSGELPFQVYFVQRGALDAVRAIRLPLAIDTRPAPGVLESISRAELVIVAPSNPFLSIEPILAVPGVRDALEQSPARRIAVSPIVGGEAVKGPAADLLRTLGHEVSATGVASLFRGLIDCFVLDAVDVLLVPAIEAIGMRAVAVDTMMVDQQARARVARDVLEAARA
ncbi:MAG TPA: 2-phospho-L-lactate transferase [Dehalococcoidia bacterium]|nr:2-phospho-L-lactate transferase [Dehalococcoidia bacterium]